jgi:hypothetical protein
MKTRNTLLVLLAAAGIGIFALAETQSPSVNTDGSSLAESVAPNQCYYTWATKELPDISAEFQATVQTVIPGAEARASAYGEDCVYADGSATFGALETDFYVTVPVADLADDETLGTFIEQILPIVDEFSRPRVPGPQAGFVEFTFKNGAEQRILRVPIPLGKQLREQGLRGVELLEALDIP